GCATHAVLPYANALRLLPAYLQQLEMESNGKRVDRAGRTIDYATAPVLWGAEGTVRQHSFHQLLHQRTHVVPCDFIDLGLEQQQLRPVGGRPRQGGGSESAVQEIAMHQQPCDLSSRKFLKMVGVHSQREIDQAVQKAMMSDKLQGSERLDAKCPLEIPAL